MDPTTERFTDVCTEPLKPPTVNWTTALDVPAVVGVPDMVQLFGSMAIPAGSAPDATVQTGEVPSNPTALIEILLGCQR